MKQFFFTPNTCYLTMYMMIAYQSNMNDIFQLQGIITRHNLTHEFLEMCKEHLEGSNEEE